MRLPALHLSTSAAIVIITLKLVAWLGTMMYGPLEKKPMQSGNRQRASGFSLHSIYMHHHATRSWSQEAFKMWTVSTEVTWLRHLATVAWTKWSIGLHFAILSRGDAPDHIFEDNQKLNTWKLIQWLSHNSCVAQEYDILHFFSYISN